METPATGRRHRVALALLEDGTLAAHFAAAPRFLVVELRGRRVQASEERRNTRRCPEPDSLGCWDVIEEVLPDVSVVISGGMGENAYLGLLRRDVLPLLTETTDPGRALTDYRKRRLADRPGLVRPATRRDRP